MNGIFWKLFQNLPWYMPGPHAKFHQNCCTSLGEKRAQDTDGHSFIIIRMFKESNIISQAINYVIWH